MLLTGKIGYYKHLAGEKILPSDQHRLIEGLITKQGHKSEEEQEKLTDINRHYNAIEGVNQMFINFTGLVCEIRYKAIKFKKVKKLSLKKCCKD